MAAGLGSNASRARADRAELAAAPLVGDSLGGVDRRPLPTHMKTLTHEEVARCARQIWHEYGQPSGRDTEIWFEAERRLNAGTADAGSAPSESDQENSRTVSESKGAVGLAHREPSDQATPPSAENVSAPPMPAKEEIQASQQKKSARAPKVAVKSAPKVSPAPPGKPLWNRPHST